MHAIDIVKRYITLSNDANLAEIAKLFTEDSLYNSENTGSFRGRTEIMAMMKTFFENYSNLNWEVTQLTKVKPDTIIFDFTLTGFNQSGNKLNITATETITIENNQISQLHIKNR